MIAEIFLHLVNMSITAGWLILAVVILRLLLKKAPKWIHCLLWCMVGIRLILPISIESVFSLVPSANTVSQEILYDTSPTIDSGINYVNGAVNSVLQENFSPNPVASVNPLQMVAFVAENIWVLGMAVLLLYTTITYIGLKRRVREAVRFEGNIYQSERVASPFVLGIIRPHIYIPYGLQGEELQCVIAHEQAHIKRLDHLWKPIAFLVLTVYWFNPLVWLAYILLCRDIEFACDEKVMVQLGDDMKKVYSTALLHCSVSGNSSRRMIAACPVAFGEVGVKRRIRSVLHYKKPTFWIVAVAIVVCLICVVCFMTNPKDGANGINENTVAASEAVFGMSDIDVSTIQWENISQIAIYADGYYGRTLDQPLLFTEEAQIEELVKLANPSMQEYQLAEEDLEGLCRIFVDFGNGVVLSMYVGDNYGVISDAGQTTGSPYVKFPQELYDKVIMLLANNIPMHKDSYQKEEGHEPSLDEIFEGNTKEVLQSPPAMVLQDAFSSTLNCFKVNSGTYSWNYRSNGEMSGIEACGLAPTSAVKGQEWLRVVDYNKIDYAPYLASFSVAPDRVTLREYDSMDLGKEDAKVISEIVYEEAFYFELKARRIYEVIAEWDEAHAEEYGFYGRAYYAFATDNTMLALEDAVTIEAQVKEVMADKEECIVISSKSDDFPGAFMLRVPSEVYDEKNLQGGNLILVTMRDTKTEENHLPVYKALYLERRPDFNETEIIGSIEVTQSGRIDEDLEIALDEPFLEEVNILSGVTMNMWKCKATEGDVEFFNESDKEFTYGDYYDIQVQKGGEWYSLQLQNECVFNEIGYILPVGEGRTWSVNWEYLYGTLPEGKYRIVKDVLDIRAPGDYTKYYLAAEFEIMPSE